MQRLLAPGDARPHVLADAVQTLGSRAAPGGGGRRLRAERANFGRVRRAIVAVAAASPVSVATAGGDEEAGGAASKGAATAAAAAGRGAAEEGGSGARTAAAARCPPWCALRLNGPSMCFARWLSGSSAGVFG